MRHYHVKNEEDLIRQLESDPELLEEFKAVEPVEGRYDTRSLRKPVHA